MLDYLVLYLTVYPIILYIYSNVRGEKLNYVEKIIAVIAFIAVVQGCFYFLPGNFIVLILLSYFKNRELPVSLHVFYGIFPWLVEGIFRRLTAFYFLPTIGLNYIDIDHNNIVFISVELLSLVIYIGLIKISKFDFQTFIEMVSIKKLKVFLIITDIGMVLFYVAMEFLTGMEFQGGVSTPVLLGLFE
jgi:two-component system sensor histidine kinase AgrC